MGRDARWEDVPGLVVALYRDVAAAAFAVKLAHARDPNAVYWDPATGRTDAFPWGAGWLLVKRADGDGAFLRGPADAFAAAQRPLGGPHPLAASIVGGLLGAGLGYGGGWLAEHALPGGTVRRGPLRRTLAAAGGALGAVPGAVWAGANLANPADTGGGFKALTSPWPFKETAAAAAAVKAATADSGAFYAPVIPVDDFNRAVWNDVHAAPNPFERWGGNVTPGGTPGPAAAAVSGLVAGAGAATGSGSVSPYQVAIAAAAAGGKGYLAGALAGRVLGALAGLTPAAQQSLRAGGMWAGIVGGIADSVFG